MDGLRQRIAQEKDPRQKATLERVVFKGKQKIEVFQSYVREVVRQVTDAAQKVDVPKFSGEFPGIRNVGIDPAGVRRIYKLAQQPEPAE